MDSRNANNQCKIHKRKNRRIHRGWRIHAGSHFVGNAHRQMQYSLQRQIHIYGHCREGQVRHAKQRGTWRNVWDSLRKVCRRLCERNETRKILDLKEVRRISLHLRVNLEHGRSWPRNLETSVQQPTGNIVSDAWQPDRVILVDCNWDGIT